jgi:hypothetical protein
MPVRGAVSAAAVAALLVLLFLLKRKKKNDLLPDDELDSGGTETLSINEEDEKAYVSEYGFSDGPSKVDGEDLHDPDVDPVLEFEDEGRMEVSQYGLSEGREDAPLSNE